MNYILLHMIHDTIIPTDYNNIQNIAKLYYLVGKNINVININTILSINSYISK